MRYINNLAKKHGYLTAVRHALAASACFICICAAGMTAWARTVEQEYFYIGAELLASGKDAYDIRLTVEKNLGEDWEGTVRLMIGGNYGSLTDCAYDTELSLPQGSTKQFVVSVPKESVTSANGDVQVTLLDGNSDMAVAYEMFGKLLGDDMNALAMGILSDDYPSLTYLDMGGLELYYYSGEYPIKLVELNKGNLSDSLDSLNFLVIDSYDTGVLADDEISEIRQWTDDGGVLIIGTGSYAEDTLRGFDYLGIKCMGIYPPGEKEDFGSDIYADWTQLYLAELTDSNGKYNTENFTFAMISPMGYGAVGVLPYALSELNTLDAFPYKSPSSQSSFVYSILDKVSDEARERYGGSDSSQENAYALRRLLGALGNSSTMLNFGVLKFIVVIYVILAGPVCYLVLRFMKKRELYWVAVPAMALVGILLVFLAGRGFEVVSTRVYSVTVDNLSGKGGGVTYMHCYDAGHKEWDLRLAEGYEYAGPQISYSIDADKPYYYHIRKDGNRLLFGLKPTSGFEDGYFCAGRAADEQKAGGSIESDISVGGRLTANRTVTNNTNRDFAYFAVLENDTVQVYNSLPAGESANLGDAGMVFSASLSGYYYNFYDYIREAEKNVKTEERDVITALGVGTCLAMQQVRAGETAVIGVVKDWDKAVDDNCSEVSYGCLYMIR